MRVGNYIYIASSYSNVGSVRRINLSTLTLGGGSISPNPGCFQAPSGITGLTYDGNNYVWASSKKGLLKIDTAFTLATSTLYSNCTINPTLFSDDDLSCVYVDPTNPNIILGGNSSYNLWKFDATTITSSSYNTQYQTTILSISKSPTNLTRIYLGKNNGGIEEYDINTGITGIAYYTSNSNLSSNNIRFLATDFTNDQVWAATYNGGVAVLNLSTTDINDIVISSGLNVYPNPSSGIINLKVEQMNGNIEIYDAYGSDIDQQATKSLNQQFDLSFQPNGIYFLIIKTNERMKYTKIIIQK